MAGAYSIEQIGQFILRYKTFVQETSHLRLHQFTHSFGHVRRALEALADLDRLSQRQSASRFNLFRVLRVERYEVRTHSAFLAELFRPNGTHGQRTLFLEAFLQHCSKKGDESNNFPRIESPTGAALWEVDCEKFISEGQLDIVVQSREAKFLMVIENKIDAAEQKDQIGRYQDWLSRQREYPPDRGALIYLTPDGRRASKAPNEDYFRLSYAKDVVPWLRSALRTSKPLGCGMPSSSTLT